jgi:hypothetical protein
MNGIRSRRFRLLIPALLGAVLVLAPMAPAGATTYYVKGEHCKDLDPDVSACVYLLSWQGQDSTGTHTYYQAWATENGSYSKSIDQVALWSERCANGAPNCPPYLLRTTNPDAAPSGTGNLTWHGPANVCPYYALEARATFRFWSPTYRTWKTITLNGYWVPCY